MNENYLFSFSGHLCSEQASTAKKHLLTHSLSIIKNVDYLAFLPMANLNKI